MHWFHCWHEIVDDEGNAITRIKLPYKKECKDKNKKFAYYKDGMKCLNVSYLAKCCICGKQKEIYDTVTNPSTSLNYPETRECPNEMENIDYTEPDILTFKLSSRIRKGG